MPPSTRASRAHVPHRTLIGVPCDHADDTIVSITRSHAAMSSVRARTAQRIAALGMAARLFMLSALVDEAPIDTVGSQVKDCGEGEGGNVGRK